MSEAVIRTENLVHVYPKGNVRALDGVSIEVNRGDVLSIIGQNGSGKTTLVRHFNGLLRPTEGKVFLLGEDTKSMSISYLSERCGYVFQNPNHQIFCSSVEEELLVAPVNYGYDEAKKKQNLERVVDLMNIGSLLKKHPMTLDYTTKKIITIASVLIFSPEVLVLDEPTGGLDEVGRKMLTKIIRMMHEEGHTVVMISHDMDYVSENSSRVIMMAQAHVLDDADPADIFLKPQLLKQAQITPPQITQLDIAINAGNISKPALSVDEFVRKYK